MTSTGRTSTYKDRIVTYSDESKSTALSLWTVLDLPNNRGATATLFTWDVSDADPTWARLQIEFEPDPAAADQFRPLFQLQYFSMTNNVWLNQRLWDYGTAYDWQYSVELFDKNGARYARNYKWDDDTWRYYDYDHNGKDWTRIKEYVLADKTTVSQKEVLYDDGHFVIQRWDVDGSKPWRRYYVRKEDENAVNNSWEWYIDDNGQTHYVVGDASGAVEDPTAPPNPDPDAGLSAFDDASSQVIPFALRATALKALAQTGHHADDFRFVA